MSWKKRSAHSNIPPGHNAPDYGMGSEYFTIKMHHHGKFTINLRMRYIEGAPDYFDYCSIDEMSMLEVREMANLCNIDPDSVAFTFSKSGVDDCNNLSVLETDINAMNMVHFLDEDNCIGVYVEHDESESRSNVEEYTEGNNGEEELGEEEEEDGGFDYEVDEGLDFLVDMPSNTENEASRVDELINLDDLIDHNNRYEVVETQSIGEDSVHSVIFVDSDGYISDENVVTGDVDAGGITTTTVIPKSSLSAINPNEPQLRHPIEFYGEFQVFNPRVDMEDPQFHEGLIFDDAATFRSAVRKHSMKHGRDLKFKKNDADKIRVVCKKELCHWYIYASSYNKVEKITLQVKTFRGPHQCGREGKVTAATSTWVAKKYHVNISTNPDWTAKSMIEVVKKDTHLNLNRYQMYRAKKKVKSFAMGDEEKQYGMLWRYAGEMMKSDPQSTVRIKIREIEGKKLFSRIYICWGVLKRGFSDGCRQILCLDGCHIKTNYGGIILTALGLDANNGMYPLAYAIVEKEKKETWKWFLEYVKSDLNIYDDTSSWTFMSDIQKGLIYAVEELFPNCHHRFCVFHMYNNFRQHHRGLAFKKIMWKAARCTRVVDFQKVLDDLAKKDLKAFQWLAKNRAQGWSRSYFKTGAKSDMLLNNLCESFNKMILGARKKPIIEMLKEIRVILMTRLYVNRDKMRKWHAEICPRIHKKLEELKKIAGGLKSEWNGDFEFHISDSENGDFKVHSGDMTCTFRRWQLTGYPCAHAIVAFFYMGWNVEHFVDECYKKNTYLQVYSHCMHVLNGVDEWTYSNQPELLPPLIEKLPGRPKKHVRRNSKLEIEETKAKMAQEKAKQTGRLGKHEKVISCSYCKVLCHNKATYQLRKKHLAKQGGGSGSEAGSVVIVPNTKSAISEAVRNLNEEHRKQLQMEKRKHERVVASMQESYGGGTSSPSELQVIRGVSQENMLFTQESAAGDVDKRKKKNSPRF